MKFLMQGIDINTDEVKDAHALENALLFVIRSYYPNIKIWDVKYDFNLEEKKATITFFRDTKYYLHGEIKDVDAKLITGLPEDLFYPSPGKNYFFLWGYADGYYVDGQEIKNEFMSCQALENVKDVCFSTSDSYLQISIYGN